MSKENVQRLYDVAIKNEEFHKELKEAAVAGNLMEFVKEKGFELTQIEQDEFIREMTDGVGKLSDTRLEEVAGGAEPPIGGRYIVDKDEIGIILNGSIRIIPNK